MNYFILGDIHGCYYTLTKILKRYWHSDKEVLLSLGDLVHKGKHTFKVLDYMMSLKERMDEKVIILKGNNEDLFIKYFKRIDPTSAEQKFGRHDLDFRETMEWIENLPYFWENEKIFASHAGISSHDRYPNIDKFDILYNREKLVNIGKLQFLGHIVVGKEPHYDDNANAWYLDTGAGYGKRLTAAKVTSEGNILGFVHTKVSKKDF